MSAIKFKLTLDPKKSAMSMGYQDHLFLIGSCFTENIGAKMKAHMFTVMENPHGILFNPVSVMRAMDDYIQNKKYGEQDLFEYNELFNSWQHHTRFSDLTTTLALEKINASIHDAHHYLKQANKLIITLGSAWLYELTALAPQGPGIIVANNHKGPANWFTKKLMDPFELSSQLQNMVSQLQAFNINLDIIFTISPVRHLREGLVENNKSKSVLNVAVHDVIAKSSKVEYFPAYEYVIDDLRDYRFYAEDLVHPNYAATNYVWEKWVDTYVAEDTRDIMKQVIELQLAMQHKPFNKASKAHQSFVRSSLVKANALLEQYPFLPLQQAIRFFNGELVNIT